MFARPVNETNPLAPSLKWHSTPSTEINVPSSKINAGLVLPSPPSNFI